MKRLFAMSLLAALTFVALSPGHAGSGLPVLAQQPPSPAPAPPPPLLDLFFMGNRSSRLEPCGCHSKQQGGVQYEAVIYNQHQATPSLRVDLGEWTAFGINTRPIDLMTTRYLMRALTMLKMDAVNIGLRDIDLTAEYLKGFNEKYPGQMPPLVSANTFLKDQPAKLAFAPYRIVEKKLAGGATVKVGLTGVAWLVDEDTIMPAGTPIPTRRESISYEARSPLPCLAPVIKELRPKVDLLLVLSSGDVGSGSEIAKAFPDVDLVLARNAFDAPQVESSQIGNVRILFGRNAQGKELGYVPLEPGARGKWQFKARPEYLGVTKDVEPQAEYLALIEEFKKETQSLKPVLPAKGVKAIYAGARRCQLCHEKEYNAWQKTRHSQAISTLINKGQQFNPSCLKCHVTGYQESNGFYAIDHWESEIMTSVQCEMCHGPSLVHSDAQERKLAGGEQFMPREDFLKLMDDEKKARPHKVVPAATCLKCHTPENDDKFDYTLKLPKVMH